MEKVTFFERDGIGIDLVGFWSPQSKISSVSISSTRHVVIFNLDDFSLTGDFGRDNDRFRIDTGILDISNFNRICGEFRN